MCQNRRNSQHAAENDYSDHITQQLTIRGLVQGVGFRPFVYIQAKKHGITGWVQNRSDSVVVIAQGSAENVEQFLDSVKKNHPPHAYIDSFESIRVERTQIHSFTIRESGDHCDAVTDVSPDIAVCPQCLADMKQQPHRIDYPFINCTFCGPRFSIIRSVPYDRAKTTMATFVMCPQCAEEYNNPLDRRFHAQPVACTNCGPSYRLYEGNQPITEIVTIITKIADVVSKGGIVAMKGIGGFHLACDPFTESAVTRLRAIKHRDGKPFALMFRDVDAIRGYAKVNAEEERLLCSPKRPIVLLSQCSRLPKGVNNNIDTIGVMLPYMPMHHLLFQKLAIPALVMTSGNISEEPIVIDNAVAYDVFGPLVDAILTYNRDIHNRIDDSVAAVFSGKSSIIRRSRGFVPEPIVLPFDCDTILAVGAELKNCFALGKGNKAILSQHIGDLKNVATFSFYKESLERFENLFRCTPSFVAHDLHPDYLSTRYATGLGLPTCAVQHHFAHIVSCMAENGIEGPVIGVAFDGTGYGNDGAVWGGEFLYADTSGYERLRHLRYTKLPGGDMAVNEPWRMGLSYLQDAYGKKCTTILPDFLNAIDKNAFSMVHYALENDIKCHRTSSMGRLFDGVAALLGLCTAISFEAEGAIRLEVQCADINLVDPYRWNTVGPAIDIRPLIRGICDDIRNNRSVSYIATRFHASIIKLVEEQCCALRETKQLEHVVLSGGCFQNRIILEGIRGTLRQAGFSVYTHSKVPCNDGGVALGQLVIASKRRTNICA